MSKKEITSIGGIRYTQGEISEYTHSEYTCDICHTAIDKQQQKNMLMHDATQVWVIFNDHFVVGHASNWHAHITCVPQWFKNLIYNWDEVMR